MVQELIDSLDVEQSVIGSILLDNNMGFFACAKYSITDDCFEDSSCRALFAASMTLSKARKGVDPRTMSAQLVKDGADISWEFMNTCMEKVPTATHAEHYVEALREVYNRRQIVAICDKARNDALMNKDIGSITAFLNAEALNVTTGDSAEYYTLADLKDEKIEQWRHAQEHGFVGVPFRSVPAINDALGGWRNGCVGIVAGYRGLGKSTLVRAECLCQAQADEATALFTIEDPKDIAAAGIVGNAANISVFGLDTGNCRPTAIDDMEAKWTEIGNIPLYISNSATKIEQIISQMTIMKQRHDIKSAWVDHVQYITPYILPGMTRNDTVAHYSSRFTDTAKALDIPIILLSQFGRQVEKENRPPRMSDLRDSGSLEQDSRQILMLYSIPEEINPDSLQFLEVVKNNYGKSGWGVPVKRQDGKQRFSQEGSIQLPPNFNGDQ